MSDKKDDPLRRLAEEIHDLVRKEGLSDLRLTHVTDAIESILRREGVRVLPPVGAKINPKGLQPGSTVVGYRLDVIPRYPDYRHILFCPLDDVQLLPDAAEKGEVK